LRLDATIVVMPAAVSASPSSFAPGDGLADAVRSINDGAEVLANSRRSSRR
jgi:hypothetical protein